MSDIELFYPKPEMFNRCFNGTLSKKKRKLTWTSDLAAFELGNYLVVPLTSSKMLREEGQIMGHCAALYDRLCHEGTVRLFSVQDLIGYRIATVSLLWRDDYWHLEQMKGPRNAGILYEQVAYQFQGCTAERLDETDLYFVGQEIVQRYRAAWSQRFYHYVVDLITPDQK